MLRYDWAEFFQKINSLDLADLLKEEFLGFRVDLVQVIGTRGPTDLADSHYLVNVVQAFE